MGSGKNPQNVLRGARNRASGNRFEELIEAACEYYDTEELAYIKKTPEPMRPIRQMSGGHFEAYYAKKAQPDFKGVLVGGRAVAFEAKHTETDRMQQSVVNEEQCKSLNRHMSMGAECFIMVSFDFRLFYKIPWSVWQAMKAIYGRKYITSEDVGSYRVAYRSGVLDFLHTGGQRHG